MSDPAEDKLLLVGVDLTRVDVTKPFTIDFSVAPDATLKVKRAALARGRAAFEAFDPVRRRWIVRADLNIRAGRVVMHVFPMGPPRDQRAWDDLCAAKGHT